MVGLGTFVMAPFVVMSAWGLSSGTFRPSRLLALPPSGIRWGPMLSVVFWSLEGFDSASTFAGEVDNPSRTYPRAMVLSVAMMTLAYIVPLGVGAGVDNSEWPCWHNGALSHVARQIGGKFLGGWVLLSAVVSNWGLFASELLEDSYQLLGMAQVGLAPTFLGRRSETFHTPVNAILLQVCIIAMLLGLDFDLIMGVDNFFSAVASTLELAAAVELRRSHAALARPYRVPLGTRGLTLLVVPPMATNAYIMYTSAARSLLSALLVGAALTTGLLLYVPFLYGWRGKPKAPSRLPSADAHGTPIMLPSSPAVAGAGVSGERGERGELPHYSLAEPLPPSHYG